ncbi:MAG: helix-turn-helix transcriptional regulator [Dorea sp.]|nr:helix-turn-helix transcriptional regulator [Dorea sp.]
MGINEIIQIGNRLRELRTKKGFTQKEISELAGIPYSTYSNYENNNREPSLEQLKKIADALEIKILDILDINEYIEQTRLEKEDSLLNYLYKLGIEIESIDGYSYIVKYKKKKYVIKDSDYEKLVYSISAFTKFTLDNLLSGNEEQ